MYLRKAVLAIAISAAVVYSVGAVASASEYEAKLEPNPIESFTPLDDSAIKPVSQSFYYVSEYDLLNEVLPHELDFIALFMSKTEDEITYVDVLNDVNGLYTYILAEFSSGGYAIMLRTTARVVEYGCQGDGSPDTKQLNWRVTSVARFTKLFRGYADILVYNNK